MNAKRATRVTQNEENASIIMADISALAMTVINSVATIGVYVSNLNVLNTNNV